MHARSSFCGRSKRKLLFAPAYFVVELRAPLYGAAEKFRSSRFSWRLGWSLKRSFEMVIKTGGGEFSHRPILQWMSDKLDLRRSGKLSHPTQLTLGKGRFFLA
jgi:hypothetical protein